MSLGIKSDSFDFWGIKNKEIIYKNQNQNLLLILIIRIKNIFIILIIWVIDNNGCNGL